MTKDDWDELAANALAMLFGVILGASIMLPMIGVLTWLGFNI